MEDKDVSSRSPLRRILVVLAVAALVAIVRRILRRTEPIDDQAAFWQDVDAERHVTRAPVPGASPPPGAAAPPEQVASGTASTPRPPASAPAEAAASTAPAAEPAAPAEPEAPAEAAAPPDDLKRIVGVGPVLERKLHALGITTFRKLAELSPDDVREVSAHFGEFRDRIVRERWQEQARELHAATHGETLGDAGPTR